MQPARGCVTTLRRCSSRCRRTRLPRRPRPRPPCRTACTTTSSFTGTATSRCRAARALQASPPGPPQPSTRPSRPRGSPRRCRTTSYRPRSAISRLSLTLAAQYALSVCVTVGFPSFCLSVCPVGRWQQRREKRYETQHFYSVFSLSFVCFFDAGRIVCGISVYVTGGCPSVCPVDRRPVSSSDVVCC